MEQNIDNINQQIEFLRTFVSEERFARLEGRLQDRTRHMLLCLEDIFYPHNASATIRSAEAFGLQEVHAVQSLCHFRPSRHIVRGTDQWIDINRWNSTPELVAELRQRGYKIVITTPRPGSATVETFDVQQPFAVFMGTEKTGISEWLTTEADQGLYIPMSGFAESLNISVSAAIITQRLTEKIRRMQPSQQWQLSELDRRQTMLKWLKCSIRDVENILKRMP